jgi:hypothetical protein
MQHENNEDAPQHPRLGNTSPGLVAVYTVLTLGLYIPFWYLKRVNELNALGSDVRLSTRPVWVLMGIYILNASGMLSVVGGDDPNATILLSTLGHGMTLASGMILVTLRLRTRDMLIRTYGDQFSPSMLLSGIASFIVGEIYLQARMNRLPAPHQELPMASPVSTTAVPAP